MATTLDADSTGQTSDAAASSNTEAFPFLSLPPELRNLVYSYMAEPRRALNQLTG